MQDAVIFYKLLLIAENFGQDAVSADRDAVRFFLRLQGVPGGRLGEIVGVFGEDPAGGVAVVEQLCSIVPQVDAKSRVFFVRGKPAGGEYRLLADGFGHGVGLARKGG